MSKKPVIAANWKAKLSQGETIQLTNEYVEQPKREDVDIIIFPSLLHIAPVADLLNGSGIAVGAQNMHWDDNGPYTGEVCASQLIDLGVQYVLLGHSERREYFSESYENVNRKLKLAIKMGISPILCLGESAKEREAGISEMVIVDQLESALQDVKPPDLHDMIIMYEPIWAIGSGNPVPVEESEHVMEMLQRYIKKHFTNKTQELETNNIRLIYGGSISAEQAASYLRTAHTDGVLVGRASLASENFQKIVGCCP